MKKVGIKVGIIFALATPTIVIACDNKSIKVETFSNKLNNELKKLQNFTINETNFHLWEINRSYNSLNNYMEGFISVVQTNKNNDDWRYTNKDIEIEIKLIKRRKGDDILSHYLAWSQINQSSSTNSLAIVSNYKDGVGIKEPVNAEIIAAIIKKPMTIESKQMVIAVYLRSWDKKEMINKNITISYPTLKFGIYPSFKAYADLY